MAIQRNRARGQPTPSGRQVYYPTSDGKPEAETDLHRDEMMRLNQTFQEAFAERVDVYNSGNLLLYHEEGNPRASVAPDVFVVKGVAKHRREIYKLWEEDVAPAVVIEVTPRSKRQEDQAKKRALYARLGVPEYFLYDPLAEYLHPALQGYRLDGSESSAMAPDQDGALLSDELGMRLALVDGRLRLFDRQMGSPLLDPIERATAAERRVAELEALLARREAP